MGGKLSKWQVQPQGGLPESVDTTGRYEATGDIFTDLLRSCEVTDKQRKTTLCMLKKKFPKSYEKRFGEKTVSEVLAELLMVTGNANNSGAKVSNQEVDKRDQPACAISYVANPMTVQQFHMQTKVDTPDHIVELVMQILESDKLSKKKKRTLLEHFEELFPGTIERIFEDEDESDDENSEMDRGDGPAGDCGKKKLINQGLKAEYV